MEPDKVWDDIPEEFQGYKYLVFRGKQEGNRFFSDNKSNRYISSWYDILYGADTTEECQRFLGYIK